MLVHTSRREHLEEAKMKHSLGKLAACLALAGMTALGLPLSSSSRTQDQSGNKSKTDTRNITGCLAKSGTDKYTLAAEDGTTWNLTSSSVNLGNHVGHEVTVTGVVANSKAHNMKEDAKDMASDAGAKKNNTEHGHLKVTDLKMVSDTCTK
jgi:hypothetical protein